MDKNVGKKGMMLLCLLLMDMLGMAEPVVLRALSLQGVPLAQAAAGSPFYLEVARSGNAADMQSPVIPGLDAGAITSRSTRIQTINGKTTVSYRYEVCLTQPGSYTFGPVELPSEQGPISSGVVTLQVVPAQLAEKNQHENASKEEPALLRLRLDKPRVVVGEKVRCTLQFLYDDEHVALRNIGEPALNMFTVSQEQGPIAGVIDDKGRSVHVLTWQWSLCPTSSGTIIIPAYRADFTVPQEHDNQQDQFSFFAPFFRPRLQQKRIYSNTATISVDPLPAHDGPVNAIGFYTNYYASLQPTVAKEGDGMVLTLEIEGPRDVDAIATPALINMPHELRFYDSKNYTKQEQQGVKKCFEYIVQGMQPGSYEIPSQRFVFFDVTSRSYKELATKPLTVTVLAQQSLPVTQRSTSQPVNGDASDVNTLVLPLCVCQTGACDQQAIPWWLFIFFTSLPLVIWLCIGMLALIKRYRSAYSPQLRKKYAWTNARKVLAHAKRHHACEQVYPLFMAACAARMGVNPQKLSQDMIDETLRKAGVLEEQLEAWNNFYARMTELVFFKHKLQATVAAEFFDEAWRWLSFLEVRI